MFRCQVFSRCYELSSSSKISVGILLPEIVTQISLSNNKSKEISISPEALDKIYEFRNMIFEFFANPSKHFEKHCLDVDTELDCLYIYNEKAVRFSRNDIYISIREKSFYNLINLFLAIKNSVVALQQQEYSVKSCVDKFVKLINHYDSEDDARAKIYKSEMFDSSAILDSELVGIAIKELIEIRRRTEHFVPNFYVKIK